MNNKVYYQVLTPTLNTNIENERPLYDQILQQEAMELHKLYNLVKSKGGKLQISTLIQ